MSHVHVPGQRCKSCAAAKRRAQRRERDVRFPNWRAVKKAIYWMIHWLRWAQIEGAWQLRRKG